MSKLVNLHSVDCASLWSKSVVMIHVNMHTQGELQEWTERSTLIFKNPKPVEISKNIFNIIWISLKVVKISKIRRVWLKNYSYHALFSFEIDSDFDIGAKLSFLKITQKPLILELSCKNNMFYPMSQLLKLPKGEDSSCNIDGFIQGVSFGYDLK